MFDILLNFLFPPRCPACERYVEVRGGWCAACLAKAAAVRRLRTTVEERDTIAEAWALGIYEGALRDLVRHLKYQKKMDALPYLQTFLHAVEEDFFRAADVSPHPVAVPVPLFAAKEKKRGFNQTNARSRWSACSSAHARRSRSTDSRRKSDPRTCAEPLL